MYGIVVVDENWAIGRGGNLLVHLPGDLKYYREKTLGKTIIVGRKTLESFPGSKPLPGRENIVLTRDREFQPEGCVVCHTKEEALAHVSARHTDQVFVAGGSEIYRTFFDACDAFYVTRIYDSYEADRYFPNLDQLGFSITWSSPMQQERGIRYRFLKYDRTGEICQR